MKKFDMKLRIVFLEQEVLSLRRQIDELQRPIMPPFESSSGEISTPASADEGITCWNEK